MSCLCCSLLTWQKLEVVDEVMKGAKERDRSSSAVTTVLATPGHGSDKPQEISYTDTKVIGNGSFGVVYQARMVEADEVIAIKKVLSLAKISRV